MRIKNSTFLCTKCCMCFVGCLTAIKLFCLLRIIIISSVHGIFSLPTNLYAKKLKLKMFAKEILRNFDTGTVKKLKTTRFGRKKPFVIE